LVVYLSWLSPNYLYLTWDWIGRWLSGSALKQVAAFGCPDTNKSAVFPAKRLRKFFEVPENTVTCFLKGFLFICGQDLYVGVLGIVLESKLKFHFDNHNKGLLYQLV